MTGSCLLVGYGIVGIKQTHCPTISQLTEIFLSKVSGEPSYDSLNQIWQNQRVPEDLYDNCITEIDNKSYADRKFVFIVTIQTNGTRQDSATMLLRHMHVQNYLPEGLTM